MLCTISKQVPTEPVVSKLSGCLYERRLITKYIEENGCDPKTGEPMSMSDLILVSCAKESHVAVNTATIPGLLTSLQAEWDSVMLEQFSLRQQLTQAHQELSRALYQHEASCRVIAKLLKERDALRVRLQGCGVPAGDLENDDVSDVLPKEILDEIDDNAKHLKAHRQRRELPVDLAPASYVAAFVEDDVVQPHTTTGSGVMGVLCLDVVDDEKRFIATGGSDSRVVCYDIDSRVVKSTLLGHTRPIRAVKCLDEVIISASDDSTLRVWKNSGTSYQNSRVIKVHQSGVVGFSVLPSLRHVLSAGSDAKLAFTDFERGFTVAIGEYKDTNTGFSCIGLHPDGYMAVTGYTDKILIWDVKQMDVRQSAGIGSQGFVTSVCFNEDGYTLAASTSSGPVKLFDFRRLDSPLEDVVSPADINTNDLRVTSNRVSFSRDGTYLLVCSNIVRVWNWKTREVVTSLAYHSAAVTDAAWGKNAQWMASTSLDKTLRIYRKK